jgi:hypothetical protein
LIRRQPILNPATWWMTVETRTCDDSGWYAEKGLVMKRGEFREV